MTTNINLADIQGNVTRAYGKYRYPFARYFFFNFGVYQENKRALSGEKPRLFVNALRRYVTTAAPWPDRDSGPDCTMNVGFSYLGMEALEVPVRTLRGMPDEFIAGMKGRAFILGDRDQTQQEDEAEAADWDQHWDAIWRRNRNAEHGLATDVHMIVTLNAKHIGDGNPHDALETMTTMLLDLAKQHDVIPLRGFGPDDGLDPGYQAANSIFTKLDDGTIVPTAKEHFGFTDGIGDPVFEGQRNNPAEEKAQAIGRGKLIPSHGDKDEGNKWHPIATGEFLLGHPDESQEIPPACLPAEFSHNGTFMSYRKLHENVGTFSEVIDSEAADYAKVMNVPVDQARETIMAKMVGRWSDGIPITKFPTYEKWKAFRAEQAFETADGKVNLAEANNMRKYLASPDARNFRYADDMHGTKCPVGAHIRRANTRDYLDPLNEYGQSNRNINATSALNNRRRILRRGLPYGPVMGGDASETGKTSEINDTTQQGIIMMAIGSSLFRQFEFVQQQWMQYGLDFNQGNDTCPLVGNHAAHTDPAKQHLNNRNFTIPGDKASERPPYVMSRLKTFVECRGGEYFFIPSMTGLRMMATGIIDPT